MKTKDFIGLIAALATIGLGFYGSYSSYRNSSPKYLNKKYQEQHLALSPLESFFHGQAVHNGCSEFVSDSDKIRTSDIGKPRDFDGDRKNDPYFICKDGAILAQLTKNSEKPGYYWYDLGKE